MDLPRPRRFQGRAASILIWVLEHRAVSLHHLMLASSSFGKARRAERCGSSGKRCNAADGLLSITRRAGLLCPLISLDRTCRGKHHGAQSASSADKGDTVKWCTLIDRCSNPSAVQHARQRDHGQRSPRSNTSDRSLPEAGSNALSRSQ